MSSLNKVQLIGRLGQDPEVRHTSDGRMIVSLSLATSETWRDKDTGEKKERTNWHRVVIFNEGLAKVAEKYLKKGGQVYVEGAMETRKYTDKEGAERYVTEVVLRAYRGEVVLLGGTGSGSGPGRASSEDDYGTTRSPDSGKGGKPTGGGSNGVRDLDDEVPF